VCGIAGIVRAGAEPRVEEEALLRMARAIRHRGPDGYGLATCDGAGFVSTRLAIIDLPGGWQPLEAGPGDLLVYNGEVYNHIELRDDLRRTGAAFETSSDTEVVLHLLERDGLEALDRCNGQFAFAWWQASARRLTLVRDRFGVRPLYYALLADGSLVFGSEAKALFASGEVVPRPDLAGIDDVFTTWGARPPRSPFAGVDQVEPGGVLVWENGRVVAERRWWAPTYDPTAPDTGHLLDLLRDSVDLRLRADVPVGAYLSGGLDSSLISALAQVRKGGELRTFSIAFKDPRYDERAQQQAVADALGTKHHVVEAGPEEIAAALPDVVRHTETPLIRTAPVPLFLLAREVRANDLTVVITGEGADELFWGYDLFKEVAIRELHRRDPERALEMLDGLYPYLGETGARRGPAFAKFLLETGADDPELGSHLTRAEATATVKAFYSPDVAAEARDGASLRRLRAALPEGFPRWSALERAAWLEVTTLLEPYLLGAQGDRVAMASGVEGRFPFLDHRVFAHSVALPAERKLDGTRDKVALRELAEGLLPAEIVERPKQPYRAPEVTPFFADGAPEWVEEVLTPAAIADAGFWDSRTVAGLVRRCRAGRATGMREGMALVGILTTQLWHQTFCGAGRDAYAAETDTPRVRIQRTRDDEIGGTE
jgi:asparagine synthase (glutamine-hydrolysing)